MALIQQQKKLYTIVNFLFFFCVFNPFVSPLPIGTDVQLPVFALAFVLFILAVLNGKVFFDRGQIILIMIALWTFAYLGLEGTFNPRYRLGLPLGILVLFVVQIYWQSLTIRAVQAAILFNSIGIFLHKFFPSQFVPIAETITREIKIKEIGARGASGFCPEPGLASASLIILFITLVYFREKRQLSKTLFFLNSSILLCCMFFTQSASGILFMMITLFVYLSFNLRFNKRYVIICMLIPGLITYLINTNYFENTRAGSLILLTISNPLGVLRMDGSLAERAAGITFGFYGIREWFFGFGGGSYSNVAPHLDTKYHVMDYYDTARDQTQQTVSAFGTYTLEFGVIFWLFLIIVFYSSYAFSATAIASLALASLFILASFSITFPGIWYLLVLSMQYQRKRRL